MTIQEILNSDDIAQKKALFQFDEFNTIEEIRVKFNLWSRYNFPKYFSSPDASFFVRLDTFNIKVYLGEEPWFIDIAFRGAAKTARTKLFIGFAIANDKRHFRKFIKVLSADGTNSKQITTDVYNILVTPSVAQMYPEIFEKSDSKRQETMSTFTTATGVKVLADTVGTDQRGSLQEEARPDLIWYEDFENRKTLYSAKETKKIWDNMEEARTGLSKNGSCIYTCNYISEMGNVHRLVTDRGSRGILFVVPIMIGNALTWPERYTMEEVIQMKIDDDDFEGERMCQPSASKDVLFDRESIEKKQIPIEPIKEIAGFKIFKSYDPSHCYGSGHDVAHGVGLDSSTSVFIDFTCFPAEVTGTFKDNNIKSDTFGDEISREGDIFGKPICGIEKNDQGNTTIARAKQLGVALYATQAKDTKISANVPTEYGWHTNAATKPKMLFDFAKAVADGLINLNDAALIAECKAYTRNDLIDNQKDPRLTTRHFDLLIAACIAWQMRNFANISNSNRENQELPQEDAPLYPGIGI